MGGLPQPAAAQTVAERIERRPVDMTDAELAALPVGPFVLRERPVTAEDRARGVYGRTIMWEEARKVRATAYRASDILAWYDGEGRVWDFGQWADGSWFKQRSVLS